MSYKTDPDDSTKVTFAGLTFTYNWFYDDN